MSIEKVLEKVRKLLALAKSSNEHEAASAAAKAAELMQEHQLEEAQLRVEDDTIKADPIEEESLFGDLRGNKVYWKASLAFGIARSVGAFTFWTGGALKVYGRTGAIQSVRYLFAYLVREVDRLADAKWAEASSDTYESARSWKNGFRLGAASTIKERLIAQRIEAEEKQKIEVEIKAVTSQALVVVRKDTAELDAEFRKRMRGCRKTAGPTLRSRSGFQAGREAGADVSLGGGARLGATPAKITGR